MRLNNNQQAFFALVEAGLWEREVRLSRYGKVDFNEVYRLAEEQTSVGVVTAGLEHVMDLKFSRPSVMSFVETTLQVERRNKFMNVFLQHLIEKLRKEGINAILVKGQGVGQCYERPLWRASGDIDLFLDEANYEKAKKYLSSIADSTDKEDEKRKHLGMHIHQWDVELHGTLRTYCSSTIDKVVDEVQQDTLKGNKTRVWKNGDTEILIPQEDNDIIFVFTHILEHFFKGGVGLRQICDWSRLLWTFNKTLDKELLERRLRRAGIMSEWKVFGALTVNWLGLPSEAMPFYSDSSRIRRKALRLLVCILKTGNFGHNRDQTYQRKYSYVVKKTITFIRNTKDSIRHLYIFPLDATRVWFIRLYTGVNNVLHKE